MNDTDLNIFINKYKQKRKVNNIKKNELNRFKLSSSSWHDKYKDSSYIHISGLDNKLTEGDIIIVFSQWGEPIDINLIRDKKTGFSKGYCFLCYEDQRSTILAVDNANDMILLGKTIKVEHVKDYKVKNEDYIFTGSEGGGLGVYGITKDVQNKFKKELEILKQTKKQNNILINKRIKRSLSRSISI